MSTIKGSDVNQVGAHQQKGVDVESEDDSQVRGEVPS